MGWNSKTVFMVPIMAGAYPEVTATPRLPLERSVMQLPR